MVDPNVIFVPRTPISRFPPVFSAAQEARTPVAGTRNPEPGVGARATLVEAGRHRRLLGLTNDKVSTRRCRLQQRTVSARSARVTPSPFGRSEFLPRKFQSQNDLQPRAQFHGSVSQSVVWAEKPPVCNNLGSNSNLEPHGVLVVGRHKSMNLQFSGPEWGPQWREGHTFVFRSNQIILSQVSVSE